MKIEGRRDGFTEAHRSRRFGRGRREHALALIPPDVATCPGCAAEVLDPADRRRGYAFTTCASCGPRFTILRRLPRERASTSMAAFEMCAECAREHRTPGDRRFHAESNACPRCGPRLRALTPLREPLPTNDPLGAAVAFLEAGLVVCLKGVGGFQLACDAGSSAAVRLLRTRKGQEHKPFAVMVRDVAAARKLAHVRESEAALLSSPEAPIVLLRRRDEAGLAWEVAPANPLVGLMLPPSPLHHLLLQQAERPLVVTSGNLAAAPMPRTDDEALDLLHGVADVFLVHDREIVARCDDSVARVVAGRPVVLRRSRGYVPRPIALPHRFQEPVLACGARRENAFCIAVGQVAYPGPHVGDLDSPEMGRAFAEAVDHMERLLGVEPSVLAYDLHPGYLSTAYALAREGAFKVGVQHHHAHVASALAEHRLAGPVLAAAYDGAGWGTDGTTWGGEILVADAAGYERVATFRPLAPAGEEPAGRDVWRLALALLEDAYESGPPLDELALFRLLRDGELAAARAPTLATGRRGARGVGRYFDAFGALVLGRPRAHFDGQIAQEWNLAADARERGEYPFDVDATAAPWSIDLRPTVRGVVDDVRAGRTPSVISGRFHNTIAHVTAACIRAAAQRHGAFPVVLTGGCFRNALLTERVAERLEPGLRVVLHRQIPPGDGGLALGQALVADAFTQRLSRDRASA